MENILPSALCRGTVGISPKCAPARPENKNRRLGAGFGIGKRRNPYWILAFSLIAKIKGGAKFEDVAKASSKDTGSAVNGGDLDWANSTSYVPEFSAAMTGLKKGQMTETPVKTQFGWHIIELVDTREAKIPSFEEVKPQLQQMLMGDQAWQREQFQAMMKSIKEKAKIQ